MNTHLNSEDVDYLCDAVLTLNNREECHRFFEDLCTVPELKTLSQRLAVAKMLDEHCVYTDIKDRTGASTATISRVKRVLEYGCHAFRMVFDRLAKKDTTP